MITYVKHACVFVKICYNTFRSLFSGRFFYIFVHSLNTHSYSQRTQAHYFGGITYGFRSI